MPKQLPRKIALGAILTLWFASASPAMEEIQNSEGTTVMPVAEKPGVDVQAANQQVLDAMQPVAYALSGPISQASTPATAAALPSQEGGFEDIDDAMDDWLEDFENSILPVDDPGETIQGNLLSVEIDESGNTTFYVDTDGNGKVDEEVYLWEDGDIEKLPIPGGGEYIDPEEIRKAFEENRIA